nr:protein NRT1/ PTR FAMILY 1.2-like [Ipomoea batatas]
MVDPWRLCRVDQVEELKALIRVIPIWMTGAIMSINANQSSFAVLQASSMDRHIGPNLEIPAGSVTIFAFIENGIRARGFILINGSDGGGGRDEAGRGGEGGQHRHVHTVGGAAVRTSGIGSRH